MNSEAIVQLVVVAVLTLAIFCGGIAVGMQFL